MCVSETAVVEAAVVLVVFPTSPHSGSTCALPSHKGAVRLSYLAAPNPSQSPAEAWEQVVFCKLSRALEYCECLSPLITTNEVSLVPCVSDQIPETFGKKDSYDAWIWCK